MGSDGDTEGGAEHGGYKTRSAGRRAAGGGQPQAGREGPHERPPPPHGPEMILPPPGRTKRVYANHRPRHIGFAGTANSRLASTPPGRSTRTSSRSAAAGSST